MNVVRAAVAAIALFLVAPAAAAKDHAPSHSFALHAVARPYCHAAPIEGTVESIFIACNCEFGVWIDGVLTDVVDHPFYGIYDLKTTAHKTIRVAPYVI